MCRYIKIQMKPNEQLINEAVAKVHGWKNNLHGGMYPPNMHPLANALGHTIPKYNTSYDAILLVIQRQGKEVRIDIAYRLTSSDGNVWSSLDVVCQLDATPFQLCISLLKALNLWTKEMEHE